MRNLDRRRKRLTLAFSIWHLLKLATRSRRIRRELVESLSIVNLRRACGKFDERVAERICTESARQQKQELTEISFGALSKNCKSSKNGYKIRDYKDRKRRNVAIALLQILQPHMTNYMTSWQVGFVELALARTPIHWAGILWKDTRQHTQEEKGGSINHLSPFLINFYRSMRCLTATERVQFPLLSRTNPGRYVKDVEVDTDPDEAPTSTPLARPRADDEPRGARAPRKRKWDGEADQSQRKVPTALVRRRANNEPASRPKQKALKLVLPASSADKGKKETCVPSAQTPLAVAVWVGDTGPQGASSPTPLEVLARRGAEAAAKEAARLSSRESPRISAATEILDTEDDTASEEEEMESVRAKNLELIALDQKYWQLEERYDFLQEQFTISRKLQKKALELRDDVAANAQREIEDLRAKIETDLNSKQAQNRILAEELVRQMRLLEQSEIARRSRRRVAKRLESFLSRLRDAIANLEAELAEVLRRLGLHRRADDWTGRELVRSHLRIGGIADEV
ncbi:hypothetical protein AXG93_2582s1000 [Marchantia polymorpha subsp. ruderalis]|uniref:Uncharacterized protein n=1 Tax=Marchantia polymorpha subsp. ruderalis TaxID=1480154 RepID=A0A176VPP4_MARPO|nr:hypothetical protein AXG93_2582s1000 [Marchantia polymorpha subsp. ruderalis]